MGCCTLDIFALVVAGFGGCGKTKLEKQKKVLLLLLLLLLINGVHRKREIKEFHPR
jgi:hypothetical protein